MKTIHAVFTDKEVKNIKKIKPVEMTWHKFIILAANAYRKMKGGKIKDGRQTNGNYRKR